MLGVMMVVAVDLANTSARRAFELSVAAVNGTLTHRIVGGSQGVSESVYTNLRTQLGIQRSAPSLSGRLIINERELTLIGIDPFSEAELQRGRPGLSGRDSLAGEFLSLITRGDALMMSERTAAELNLTAGETVEVTGRTGTFNLTLAETFVSSNPAATEGLVFADIAMAQGLLGRNGVVDSIDLVISDDQASRIRDWLPSRYALVDASNQNSALEQMTEAFHVNLLAMGLLSLLVATLLIYNTMTLSVLQRRSSLGILRCQGVSGTELFSLVIGEALVMGMCASIAGVLAGLGLGRLLVTLVTRTIDDLYFTISVTEFLWSPVSLVAGMGLGIGATLLAAILPAWQAVRSRPVTVQQWSNDRIWQRRLPMLAGLGLVLMVIGYLLLMPDRGTLVVGFTALMLVIFGFCFLVPAMLYSILRVILQLMGRRLSISSRLSVRGINSGISRTGLAVAALTVALSVTVGVGVMVGSFRSTVQLWLEQSLPGDLLISHESDTGLDTELMSGIQSLDVIDNAAARLVSRIESPAGPLRLLAVGDDTDTHFYLKELAAGGLQAWSAGEGVLISEPLAYLRRLELGGSLDVFTDNGLHSFPVVGIYYDYTSNLGQMAMAESQYVEHWGEFKPNRLFLTVRQGTGINDAASEIRAYLNRQSTGYQLVANEEIRRLTLEIFDRTFAITNILRLLAIVVAFVGVLSALMALQLERMKEPAILRASGMTPGQIIRLILTQTTVMGLSAGILAIPLGLLMSDILINVINRRSFGWSMQQILPADVMAEGIVLAVLAALLAGLYPAIRASRIRPALALRSA